MTQQTIKPVSILTTEPKAGWKRFTRGLAVFVVGLLLILFTSAEQKEVLYFGVAIMGSGFTYAMTGYLPMLIHRLTAARRAAEYFKQTHSDYSESDKK